MEIKTSRLLLRAFTGADTPAFVTYHAERRYAEFYAPEETTSGHARELLHRFMQWAREQPRRNYQLAICKLQSTSELIGCCGLRVADLDPGSAEFGIELAPRFWGSNYALETTRALLAFGFSELGLKKVRGITVRSQRTVARMARRFGFTVVGTHSGPAWMRARGWSQSEWQLTRESWEEALNHRSRSAPRPPG